MGDLKEIDFAQQVHRTGEPVLKIPGQVAEIHELELAGAQQVAEALPVLATIFRLRLEGRAQGVRAGIGERSGQELTVGGDDDQLDPREREPFAGLDRPPAGAGERTIVVLPEAIARPDPCPRSRRDR